jgi:hypothetical protein
MNGLFYTYINKKKFLEFLLSLPVMYKNSWALARTMSTDREKLRRNVATVIDRLSSSDFCSRGNQGGIVCLKIFGTGRNDTSLELFSVT